MSTGEIKKKYDGRIVDDVSILSVEENLKKIVSGEVPVAGNAMLYSWLKQQSSSIYIYSQLLQVMIAMTVMIWLMVMCVLRKGEGKDLTKASTIVSMPEVRKFKLELSEKQQQEVDVDLDVQCDDIGNQAPMVADVKPEVISTDALQKTKQKSEGCKEDRKVESTQSSLKKQRMSRKSIHSQSGSRITKSLQKKQWEQPIAGNENVNPSVRKNHNKLRTDPTQKEASKSTTT